MKKIIVLLFISLLFVPFFVSAAIDQNLYYGLTKNNKVIELQQYLIEKGFFLGKATGNFYSLTLNAVKQYQASKNINTTGYVGVLTRQAINTDLSGVNPLTPITPTIPTTSTPLTGTLDLVKNISYPDQLVEAPRINFKLGDFSLTNNTTEAINLNKIEVVYLRILIYMSPIFM